MMGVEPSVTVLCCTLDANVTCMFFPRESALEVHPTWLLWEAGAQSRLLLWAKLSVLANLLAWPQGVRAWDSGRWSWCGLAF